MMKKILLCLFLIVIVSIFIVGCNSVDEGTEGNETEGVTVDNVEGGESGGEATLCTPGWKCVNAKDKRYQTSNCSWNKEVINCPLGCKDNECNKGKVCSAGFGCKNNYTKAYRLEGCTWNNEKECHWGCEDGACVVAPENSSLEDAPYYEQIEGIAPVVEETNDTGTEETTVKESIEYGTLVINEKSAVSVGGVEHNISLYLIEDGEVKIMMDNSKSDFLTEGESFTFGNGITVNVHEIFFQAYPGGKKEVTYTIS
jgi:hypothetical protein